ncbi:MAG: OmpH family outer membrane protein [Desulfobacterales bacterium]|jgi:outer membrane protein
MRIRKYGLIFLVSFFSFFWLGLADAADVAKIGILNMQRVLSTSDPGKSAQAEIKKQRDKMLQDLKEKGAEIDALGKQFERESMVMSKEKREEKEREYRIRINDFKSLEKRYNSESQDLQKRLMKKIVEDVYALVEEIGKNEGYLLIVRSESVMYAPNSIDITDELIKQMNDSFAKKSGN